MAALTRRDVLARREEIVRIAHAHGASDIRLFGSVARDEADETSDIDFLVTPADITPPFFPGGLVVALEAFLGQTVQITINSSKMSERLRQGIAGDLIIL